MNQRIASANEHKGQWLEALRYGALAPVLITAYLFGAQLAGPPEAHAQASPFVQIAQIGGPVQAATVSGQGLLFTSMGPRMLILEACDPSWPIELWRSEPQDGLVHHIAMGEGALYVAAGAGGLKVFSFDHRIPQETAPIGQVAIEGVASKVVLQGNFAYVAAGAGGMSIVNISQPNEPRVVGRFSDANGNAAIVSDLAIGGSFAYAVSRNLMQVDVRDPANPRLARKVEDWADAVDVVGDRLYVAASEARPRAGREGALRTYDISDDNRPPVRLADWTGLEQARGLTMVGDRALYQGRSELRVFDMVEGGVNPLRMQSPTPDSVLNLDGDGRYAYLAAGTSGLRAIEMGGLHSSPPPMHWVLDSPIASAERVEIDGDLAFVEDEGGSESHGPPGRIAIVDLSHPYGPAVRGYVPSTVEKAGIKHHEGHLYVGAPDETLRVFDVRDPSQVREVANVQMPRDPRTRVKLPIWRIDIEGDLAYLANDTFVRVMDISDPGRPREVSSIRASGDATDIAVKDQRAYVLGPATGPVPNAPSIQIYDFFDLGDPLAFGVRDALGFRNGIRTDGNHIYVEGLQIVDVQDPDRMVERFVTRLDGRTRDIALASAHVYVASADPEGMGGQLRVFDVTRPDQPNHVATLLTVDEAYSVDADGYHVGVAALHGGLVLAHSELGQAPPAPTAAPTLAPTREPLGFEVYMPAVGRGANWECGAGR